MSHISYALSKDCMNMSDTYGMICVHCNACGRINPATKNECLISVYERHLADTKAKVAHPDFQTDLQQKNIQADIVWLTERILKAKSELEKGIGGSCEEK